MTEIFAGAVVALIGGFFVYITTGPALGAVRSRRAARELLEIRSALDKTEDSGSYLAVDTALKKEIDGLARFRDTSQRFATAMALVFAVLMAVALVAIIAPTFLIEEGQKELMRYISSGALLLGCAPLYLVGSFLFVRYPGWKSQTATVVLCLLSIFALAVGSVVVIDETTYYRQLTGL